MVKKILLTGKNLFLNLVTQGQGLGPKVKLVFFKGLKVMFWDLLSFRFWGPNPPVLPPIPLEVRIQRVEKSLASTRLLLFQRESEFFTRINRIGLLGNAIPKDGPLRRGLIKYMDVSLNEHPVVIASKTIPRLYLKMAVLQEARDRLDAEQQQNPN